MLDQVPSPLVHPQVVPPHLEVVPPHLAVLALPSRPLLQVVVEEVCPQVHCRPALVGAEVVDEAVVAAVAVVEAEEALPVHPDNFRYGSSYLEPVDLQSTNRKVK